MIYEEKTVKSERLYEGRILNLRIDTVEAEDQRYYKREIIEQKPAVVIIAIDENANILLVEQYRKAVGEKLYELPAGKIDVGEEPIAAAQRELREETKYAAKNLEYIFDSYASPGYTNEIMHFFLATDLYPAPLEQDDDENVEMLKIPLKDALKKLKIIRYEIISLCRLTLCND